MSVQPPERSAPRSTLRVLIGVCISGALLALVLNQIDGQDAWARVTQANPLWIASSFAMIAVVMVLRGLRFWLLTDGAGPTTVIASVCLQNFFNRIAPFRLGELSLPYLLNRNAGEPIAPTVISLLLVRLLELWVVIVMMGIASWIYLDGTVLSGELMIALGVGVAALLLSYRWCLSLGVKCLVAVSGRVGLMARPKVAAVIDRLEEAVLERERLSIPRQCALWVSTILVVVLNQVAFDFLLRSLGYELSFLQVITGVSATQLFGALPLPTVGSVGTHEAGWVVGFVLVGMAKSDAVVTGVASQVISLLFNAILAIPAYLYLGSIRGASEDGRGASEGG
jgi:glycosyltransferase 2 family protein